LVIFLTLIAALIASFSQILYKKNLGKKLHGIGEILGLARNPMIWLGLFGYMASLVIYLFALMNAPLSVAFPIFASAFIFVTILSALLLKERITLIRALGIMLIFIGIAIVAISA
jgi:undecaprenyl phosphate-alpha-L-ara4N flippase subunit ArnE